jgi:branched-chain amino acid transport system substrate-binding protein
VSLIEYDEEEGSTKAVAGFYSLCDRKVDAVIGGAVSVPTLAVVPISHELGIPYMVASASAEAITYDKDADETYDNVFRTSFIDPFQGKKMADFAKEKLKAKTAGILYSREDDYSIGLKESFERRASELGISVTEVEGYPIKAIDFQGQLTNIAAKKPDCLFTPGYYEKIALIASQLKSGGITCPLLGTDAWYSVTNFLSSPDLLDGSYYCSAYSSEDKRPESQEFLAAYTKRFGREPNMYDANAYDATRILLLAMEKSLKEGLRTGSEEFHQAIIDNLDETDLDCVTGHITFDEHHNPNKSAVIMKIIDGKERFFERF